MLTLATSEEPASDQLSNFMSLPGRDADDVEARRGLGSWT
jgi:hypothetical protein